MDIREIPNTTIKLECDAHQDEYTNFIHKMYDIKKEDKLTTNINCNITLPESYNIGLIYGPSGSGKSTILKTFNTNNNINTNHHWNDKPIISNFPHLTPKEVSYIFSSIGLGTIPTHLKPYHVLSNGEQFRANLAATIVLNRDKTIVIDEFTSVVDRNVAKATSYAVAKYIRKNNLKAIFASCHSDIIEWLSPDWYFNPIEGCTHYNKEGLHRPPINLQIFRTPIETWNLFKKHHYLSENLHRAAQCFLATWNNILVGFSATLKFPHPKVHNAYRESRTVILPDFQGLGIGVKLSDYIGSLYCAKNQVYYSKTTHPAMISYRLNNPKLWKLCFKGKFNMSGEWKKINLKSNDRYCYTFKYCGPPSSKEDLELLLKTNELCNRKLCEG